MRTRCSGKNSMRYGDSPAVGQSHDTAKTTALSSTCPDGWYPGSYS